MLLGCQRKGLASHRQPSQGSICISSGRWCLTQPTYGIQGPAGTSPLNLRCWTIKGGTCWNDPTSGVRLLRLCSASVFSNGNSDRGSSSNSSEEDETIAALRAHQPPPPQQHAGPPLLAPSPVVAASAAQAAKSQQPVPEEDLAKAFLHYAFPAYLHSSEDGTHTCESLEDTLATGDPGGADAASRQLWSRIRAEAERDAKSEPLLSGFLHASILEHDTFEHALAFVLASRLCNSVLLSTQLFEMFYGAIMQNTDIRCGALADVEACHDRDPACTSYSQVLLYFKGFHAIQSQRIAHLLWTRGQKVMALALQSRMSEVFAVDIHPGARLGRGLLLDHGTGVVIGETAIIGNNCSLMQNITLGGTGKETGDRHPKIMDNVLVGASATILGNIVISKGSQVGAGSLVLKPVAPHTMVAGSPAQVVGRVTGNPALRMQHWNDKFLAQDPFLNDTRRGTAARASGIMTAKGEKLSSSNVTAVPDLKDPPAPPKHEAPARQPLPQPQLRPPVPRASSNNDHVISPEYFL